MGDLKVIIFFTILGIVSGCLKTKKSSYNLLFQIVLLIIFSGTSLLIHTLYDEIEESIFSLHLQIIPEDEVECIETEYLESELNLIWIEPVPEATREPLEIQELKKQMSEMEQEINELKISQAYPIIDILSLIIDFLGQLVWPIITFFLGEKIVEMIKANRSGESKQNED